MRLAGATRAHARGVTDCRIGSDGWLDLFIVMSPHPNNLHRPFLWVDLIHESVLDIDPARPRAIEISDQLSHMLAGFRNGSFFRISSRRSLGAEDCWTPASWRPSGLAWCNRAARSPGDFSLGSPQRFPQSLPNGFAHSRNRQKVERLLNAPPIVFGHQNRIAALAGNLDGDVGSGGVVDKLIEPGTSLGDGNGCHTVSVRLSVRMSSWFFLGPTLEACSAGRRRDGCASSRRDAAWRLAVASG